jgi:hypothetical protein
MNAVRVTLTELCAPLTVRWITRTLRKHFHERTAEPQFSPLRFPSVEMAKGLYRLRKPLVLEGYGLQSLRENSILSRGTTSRAPEKLCFVSGHDFSRAINDRRNIGL